MRIGKKHNSESIEKMRISHKGCVPWNKGIPMAEETKKKMIESLRIARTGWKHSEETKRKMSLAHKGKKKPWAGKYKRSIENKRIQSEAHKREKSSFWRGGISFEPYSVDWTKTLKRAIRERDNYICQLCNQYGNVVHHIDYDKRNCFPNNLITLCFNCHSKTNFNRNYWINYFQDDFPK